ncbi:D-alanyl-D-alanine carboxypeptidase/D-alanyl-D-alanine-endopeptidase [Actinomadura flavalba]|uniref:D-alanyl-D-alanine carboxypeptidase/D-alanyl-D-alanine endopeptidase n=1 Tax=Actinomadura flavalba TaxID=1120938 RepID=UPI0003A3BD91|nr:D-alanyl-D-alanine carboxypeptidase/D-alanyl-D-alanine-endopeptidase [Actinomadura flavalba]
MITLSLLNVFSISAAVAVVNVTPARRLSPQPPAVAEREPAPTSGAVTAADHAAADVPDATVLARRLTPLLDTPKTPVNAVVLDVVTGRALFQRNAGSPATPASTTKIVTSVAALSALGPDHRITTRTVRGGGMSVILVGGGDPSLTALPPRPGQPPYASLGTLAARTAAALKAQGLTRTRVDFDATAYTGSTAAYGWKPNYIPDGEVAPVSALAVDAGRVFPADPNRKNRVANPPEAAARTFARMLTRQGVQAEAGRGVRAGPDAADLAAVQSPPLSALVEHLMTDSDNDVAEAVARQVAIKRGAPVSFAGAARAVQDELTGLGAAAGIVVNDGSGLSTRNRITPLALARLTSLAAAPDRPALRAAITGMPVAGFTGTLRPPRYTSGSAQAGAGAVRAKTGTLSGVSTLAGVTADADGRLLAFAFMAGDGSGPVDPAQLDRLASAVASCGC